MCTVLLPPGDNPIAVKKYIIYIICVTSDLILPSSVCLLNTCHSSLWNENLDKKLLYLLIHWRWSAVLLVCNTSYQHRRQSADSRLGRTYIEAYHCPGYCRWPHKVIHGTGWLALMWHLACDMIWYDMWYDMIYDMIWYDMINCNWEATR